MLKWCCLSDRELLVALARWWLTILLYIYFQGIFSIQDTGVIQGVSERRKPFV